MLLAATATALAAMRWRQDYHLAIIGAVAFAAATIGYLHRRRRWPGDTGHILGMGAGHVAMLSAFYIDNGPHLPRWDRLPPLTLWFLPSAVGAPIVTRAIVVARTRAPARTHQAAPTRGPAPGRASPRQRVQEPNSALRISC